MHQIKPNLTKFEECERIKQAQKAKEILGLKTVNPLLEKIAVPTSTFPRLGAWSHEEKDFVAQPEESMTWAGLVFRSNGGLSYIDPDTGKTMNVPDHQAVLKELKNCGFTILPYQESKIVKENSIIDFTDEKVQKERLGGELFAEVKTFETILGKDKISAGNCDVSVCSEYGSRLMRESAETGTPLSDEEKQIASFGYDQFGVSDCKEDATLAELVTNAILNDKILNMSAAEEDNAQ